MLQLKKRINFYTNKRLSVLPPLMLLLISIKMLALITKYRLKSLINSVFVPVTAKQKGREKG